MGTPATDLDFPRFALFTAAGVLLLTLGLAAAGSLAGVGRTELAASTEVQTRELRFADRQDGGIDVYDGDSSRIVSIVPPATNGFLRGVLRGLARDRRLASIGPEVPFHLVRWADGRLSLEDPATGRRVPLEVFGPDNFKVFAELLTAGGTNSADHSARVASQESF